MKAAELCNVNSIPTAPLGLIPLVSCAELGAKVDQYLVSWRRDREHEHKNTAAYSEYEKDSYIIRATTPRFGSGEGKGVLIDSVRGDDLYIFVDVCNYSITYDIAHRSNHASPDDHYADLKRVIAASEGKAKRITVIMPFLYEGRQHKRNGRESLDCALALQELTNMGVDNIITFDAHDPRVQNSIPLNGFETIQPVYQFIKGLFQACPDIKIDKNELMVISPDEGGMSRAVYMANVMGLDMGMFYKRRDYSRIVDGRNPIVAHEFLGSNIAGKDLIVLDDMISSGDSILEVSDELKKLGARRIFLCSTFGLFTNGMDKFDKAYKEGIFDYLLTTNLIYQRPELLERSYYTSCDLSKFLALIVDTLNHDESLASLLNPADRIKKFLESKGFYKAD